MQKQLPAATGWGWKLGLALLFGVVGYTVFRALTSRWVYFDELTYLTNASVFLGEEIAHYRSVRPPLVPLLLAPGLVLARAIGGADAVIVIAHLIGAALSLASLAWVGQILRRTLGPGAALAGVLAIGATPLFVRFGATAMTDLLAMGLTALCFTALVRAQKDPGWSSWLKLGGVLGAAVATKYTLGLVGFALIAAELWDARAAGRRPHFRGLALAVISGAGLCLVLILWGAISAYGWSLAEPLQRALDDQFNRNVVTSGGLGSGPSDYLSLLAYRVSGVLLPTAAIGVVVALRAPAPADRAMSCWLVFVGGGVAVVVSRTEARYALPALPALLYFSLRAARAAAEFANHRPDLRPLARRALRGVAPALVLAGAAGAVDQAIAHQHRVFTDPFVTRTVDTASALRAPGGRLLWTGSWHNVFGPGARTVARDPYFDLTHFPAFGAALLGGERVYELPERPGWSGDMLCAAFADAGDVLLLVDARRFNQGADINRALWPIQLLEVKTRIHAVRGDDGRYRDQAGEVFAHVTDDGQIELDRAIDGNAFIWTAPNARPLHQTRRSTLPAGSLFPLLDLPLVEANVLIVLDIGRHLVDPPPVAP